MPAAIAAMADLSFEMELYNGYWDSKGTVREDPPGSDLRQYRTTLTVAGRPYERMQMSAVLPYVYNVTDYSGISSRGGGPGDAALTLWYEAVLESSAWRADSVSDLVPEMDLGLTLTVPTGVSPYDDADTSFDATGRGFYRLDANLYLSKTLHPFTCSLSTAYGRHFGRDVNREYGKYVEPYRKRLGDRFNVSASLGYISYFGTGGDSVTASLSFSSLYEKDAVIDGEKLKNSGFSRNSCGLSLSYSSTDHDWSARVGYNRAIDRNGWGGDFPITETYSAGVRYGLR